VELLNQPVKHEVFGEGSVVELTDSYIEVDFPDGKKKFVFPDALGEHLFLQDEKVAAEMETLKKKIMKERHKEEEELERQRLEEFEKQQRLLERERLMKHHRLTPTSQVVFWIDDEEAEKVFDEWRIFTSLRQSGEDEGRPNRLVRLHQNSGVLLTAREPDQPEEERRIVGVFMVEENFIGKLCEDGFIPAHSRFRLRLSPEESEKLRFWKYYQNKRYPTNITWNSGRHRYFDNIWMAQILMDIAALKADQEEKQLMEDFIEHFLYLNQLERSDVPEPDGALVRLALAQQAN